MLSSETYFQWFFDKVDNSGWIFFAYLGEKNKKSDQNEQKFWEFGGCSFYFLKDAGIPLLILGQGQTCLGAENRELPNFLSRS